MPQPNRQIFREQSLEKLSSPDRLDQLMRVIKPQGWIILLALGIGIALAITWSFVGTIPSNANGTAVLIHPKKVVAFQSPGTGQLYSIDVEVNDIVEKDQLIGTIKIPDLEKELELERQRRDYIEERNRTLLARERELIAEETALLEERRKLIGERIDSIQQRMEDVRTEATTFKTAELEVVEAQEASVSSAIDTFRGLDDKLEKLLAGFEELKEADIVSEEGVLDARLRKTANELQIRDLQNEDRALDLRRLEAKKTYEDRLVRIEDLQFRAKDLTFELQDLKLRAAELERQYERQRINMETEEGEIARKIEKLEEFLENDGKVRANHRGRILEITAVEGQQVSVGHRLGKLEKLDDTKLKALAFFSLKDGKKIAEGDEIRVSPATVQRERFGGIKGKVVRVSTYAVTTEAAASEIGNLEMARSLLRGENRIEVEAELYEADTPTGYDWTSGQGPDDVEITAGTTANVRVTVEERRPITLVLPFLREFIGG